MKGLKPKKLVLFFYLTKKYGFTFLTLYHSRTPYKVLKNTLSLDYKIQIRFRYFWILRYETKWTSIFLLYFMSKVSAERRWILA